MAAKKPRVWVKRADYSDASPVTIVRSDGTSEMRAPYSPEQHAQLVATGRLPRRRVQAGSSA